MHSGVTCNEATCNAATSKLSEKAGRMIHSGPWFRRSAEASLGCCDAAAQADRATSATAHGPKGPFCPINCMRSSCGEVHTGAGCRSSLQPTSYAERRARGCVTTTSSACVDRRPRAVCSSSLLHAYITFQEVKLPYELLDTEGDS